MGKVEQKNSKNRLNVSVSIIADFSIEKFNFFFIKAKK